MTVHELRQRPVGWHPSLGRLVAVSMSPVEQADALRALASNWQRICDQLTSGHDAIIDDLAQETLQIAANGLVHEAARPGLVMLLPQLLAAVRQHADVRDGDTHPADLDCHSYEEALADALDDVDGLLFTLVVGRPLRDACRRCRHTTSNPGAWQLTISCTQHGRAL